ncbi:DUF2933 domain-containing protein [Rubrivirga marina]|uniref:DUF2933 domain-containing protein n=1 Tax=Rubrivirga marina TaxID=1196024 RepID=A0A271ITV7_9BACT|nr:DUF2933 domain-containing protein [Rubrivirga marina]
MDWLAENWFFVLLFVAFIAMHLFGHGHGGHGHGGHGGHGRDRPGPPPEDSPRAIGETARHAH